MKILRKSIHPKTQDGFVVLEAEEDEDMYHLYNLILKGDIVEATTIRNIVTESKSGARDKSRIQTRITIAVDRIEFDAEQCALRLNGKNVKENEHIKLGQYHTLEIELHRAFTITKECWDVVYRDLLEDISDPMKKADIAALVMQEGLANLCLIKSAMTKTCAKIERNLPKKKQGNQAFDKAIEKFHQDMYTAVSRHIDFDLIKVILVGSPGFLAEDFMKYLLDRSLKEDNSPIYRNKAKFVRVHASSGYKSAIEEMLGSPEIMSKLTNVKAIDEVRALKNFVETISTDPDRACYGFKEVQRANEQLAIDDLLITDQMYRCDNFDERNKYVALMESIKANGGKVFHFSSMHVSGEQLNNYTGIAATLRFPLPDLDLDEEELTNQQQAIAEANDASNSRSNSKAIQVFDEDTELLATGNEGEEEDITAFL